MVEQAKRARGRPKGAKDRHPRKVKPETPPVSAFGASPEQLDEMIEDLAGNGRDEAAHDPEERPFPSVDELRVTPERVERFTAKPSPPKPTIPDLFLHRVENGYVVRPAYPQGDRNVSTDARTWVVQTKERLAALVLELIADPLVHERAIPQSQDYYSPPIIVETGAMG